MLTDDAEALAYLLRDYGGAFVSSTASGKTVTVSVALARGDVLYCEVTAGGIEAVLYHVGPRTVSLLGDGLSPGELLEKLEERYPCKSD